MNTGKAGNALRRLATASLMVLLLAPAAAAESLDHSAWDTLIKRYVDSRHRVDYARWKSESRAPLEEYLAQLARPWPANLTESERKAALINAYNALTVQWVLRHYPIVSIWKTAKPFSDARHQVNGEKLSLDGIETRLRNMGDARIHAALVCAARSCPPLRREAYTGPELDRQLESNTREWLADGTLNEFLPERRLARVSSIFKWYRGDFDAARETLAGFLAKHGPPPARFMAAGSARIEFKDYHWGLNDTSELGAKYSGRAFYLDYLKSKAQ